MIKDIKKIVRNNKKIENKKKIMKQQENEKKI